ncbi:hypothetical protein C8Q70DRAFT_673510 [Cubamyces menziesii]|nr:hypothetical protein C8Q70DRAFT_673510 [Cubamyces menziesii]
MIRTPLRSEEIQTYWYLPYRNVLNHDAHQSSMGLPLTRAQMLNDQRNRLSPSLVIHPVCLPCPSQDERFVLMASALDALETTRAWHRHERHHGYHMELLPPTTA